MADKLFTVEEAESLLPVLESLLRVCVEGKKKLGEIEEEFQLLQNRIFLNGGTAINLLRTLRRRAEKEKTEQRIKDALGEIDAAGVQIKDLDIGLLDFPCRVNGEVILLCWKLGEAGITHWHGLHEGFRGRKPIDESIRRRDPGHSQ